jgi:alanine-glyoxylate transaminase/serine-glyoxylate transaminase/serine-pyruvate transaminase
LNCSNIPSEDELVKALQSKKFKLVTITHVDTSTGVLAPAGRFSELIHKHSPDSLIALDAVCSVASEEIRFDDWGLDIVISATQKGIGAPPGLSVVMASQRALKTLENRKAPVGSYYISWNRWLPIMRAYEEGRAMYFATPPVQLIYAFQAALKEITEGSVSLEERFALHKKVSNHFKDEVAKLGCGFVPLTRDIAANGMSAVKYPKGVTAAILPKLAEKDVVVAGGLHKEIAPTYFRVGHMGVTAVDGSRGDVEKVLKAVGAVFDETRA